MSAPVRIRVFEPEGGRSDALHRAHLKITAGKIEAELVLSVGASGAEFLSAQDAYAEPLTDFIKELNDSLQSKTATWADGRANRPGASS